MKIKVSFLLCILVVMLSCKNDKEAVDPNDISTLEKTVMEEPNGENVSKLFKKYNEIIFSRESTQSDKKKVLKKAYDMANEKKWDKELIDYSSAYLKEFPGEKGNEAKTLKLIDLMSKRQHLYTVVALRHAYMEAYPESSLIDSLKNGLDPKYPNVDSYIEMMKKRVSENADESGVNIANAREFVNVCEANALVLPQKSTTPEYLFSASQVSRIIKSFDRTLYLFDWIIDKYPKHEKAPMSLFLKGFVFENELNNIERAKVYYREFIEKYPSHDLADDVQFLLDNLGKSNEEILKMIDSSKKSDN